LRSIGRLARAPGVGEVFCRVTRGVKASAARVLLAFALGLLSLPAIAQASDVALTVNPTAYLGGGIIIVSGGVSCGAFPVSATGTRSCAQTAVVARGHHASAGKIYIAERNERNASAADE